MCSVFLLFFPGKVCFLARPPRSLCKVYGKDILTTVENDLIQDEIRELDIYKSMETAEGANYPL